MDYKSECMTVTTRNVITMMLMLLNPVYAPKFFRHGMKSQSAMEYLMTYGWAILIIATVLFLLFQLGFFNGSMFAARAPAGACQVFRTSAGTSLQGECQGELPQYVAYFNGASYITVPYSLGSYTNGPFTVSVWASPAANNPGCTTAVSAGSATSPALFLLYIGENGACGGNDAIRLYWDDGAILVYGTSASVSNSWHNYVVTKQGTSFTVYLNGAVVGTPSGSVISNTLLSTFIGAYDYEGTNGGQYFPGDLANIQIYNTSLSQAEVTALYTEGIGGAPIRPQNLTGWWPLNGNMNDYSGNNDNGQIGTGSVSYTSSWTSGYTAP